MTAEELAESVVDRWWPTAVAYPEPGGVLHEYIADAIRAAVAEERERCARLVESHDPACGEQCCIAAEIRARS